MRTLPALSVLALTSALHAQTVVFQDDFESGLSNWTAQTLWHIEDLTSPCSTNALPFQSGTKCAWFGYPSTCTIGDTNGGWADGFLEQITPVSLPANGDTLRLSFRTKSQGEDDQIWDRRTVWMLVDETGGWISLDNLISSPWQTFVYDLTPWAGHSVRLRLEFWTGDGWSNDGFGWFVDDVAITATTDSAIPFCTGEGDSGSCPCGHGAPGRGCPSSFDSQGALLAATGTPSLSNDSLVITASDVSPAVVTFFAGQSQAVSGQFHLFGDGMNCITGTVTRARALPDASGTARIPVAGGVALGQQFNVSLIGSTRYVQALYRSAGPFCTSATFNLTNGLIVTWRP